MSRPELALHIHRFDTNNVTTLFIGQSESWLIQMMRTLSALGTISSDVVNDQSGAITGYPQIEHKAFSLQVSEAREGVE